MQWKQRGQTRWATSGATLPRRAGGQKEGGRGEKGKDGGREALRAGGAPGVRPARVGGGQNPHPDTSISELSVFGSREGAAAAILRA